MSIRHCTSGHDARGMEELRIGTRSVRGGSDYASDDSYDGYDL